MMRFYGFILFVLFTCNQSNAQCPLIVDAGEDIYLCTPPTPTQINGSISGDYINFTWSPTAGLTGINTLTPTVNVTQSTNYVLTGRTANLANNLIDNGDFGGGNSGFTSDYLFNPGDLVPEGVYDVLPNPQASHPGFSPCDDHTGGGNMLAVNGAGSPNQNVWCQTVTVMPNTQYVFSAWVATLVASSPAILQFSINGGTIGSVFNAPSQTCIWQNFFTTWNSGANTSADICIVNQNTVLGGNDFALDDLLFSPICTVTDTVSVFVVNIKAMASSVVTIPCDGTNITLSGAGSSTGADITYQWETVGGNIVSGANTLAPVVNAPGEYTLTVTFEKNGYVCEKTATVNVIPNPNPFIAWINPPTPLGCGSPTLTLIGNTTQPGVSTYQWSTVNGNIVSGSTSKNCVVNQAGTYELVATNSTTGCTYTAEVTVTTATNPPTAIANSSTTITCIQNTAPLIGTGSSSGANISYLWTTTNGIINGPANTLNALAGGAGTYILGVTNSSNNCTAYDTITVASNTTLPTIVIQAPAVLDCDTDTLILSANVTPVPANLIWTASGGGTIVAGASTPTPSITSSGVYTLTAQNPSNGCTRVATQTVLADYQAPTSVIMPPDSITCQSPSISLSGNGSSSGPNFSYQWLSSNGGNVVSGANTIAPIVNTAGNYSLIVTNTQNACTALANTLVVADTNVVTAIANAPDTLTCLTSSVVLNTIGSSSGPSITYAWTTTDGVISSGGTGPNPVATQAGTYQLLLTNLANGCTATDIALVAQDTIAPNLNILPTGLLTCANPIQTIQAQNNPGNGWFSYVWTPPAGSSILSGDSTLTPSINTPGTYQLTAYNLITGCSATLSTLVTQEAGVPIALASAPAVLSCAISNINLNTSGSSTGNNFQYQWATTNGNIVNGATGAAPLVDQAGTYTLLITNANNGCTAAASVTVTQDTASPAVVVQAPAVLTCYLPAQTLQATNFSLPGNFTYQWSLAGAGNIISGASSLTPTISAGGLYNLLVTNTQNGCTASQFIAVDSNIATPAMNIIPIDTIDCTHPTQTIIAINNSLPGSFSYNWSATNGGNLLSGTDQLTPVVNAAGDYQLVVTNLINGCTATIASPVVVDTLAPSVSIAFPDTVKCNTPLITLFASNNSTANNFSYAWSASNGGNLISGVTGLTPQVNAGGLYTLTTRNNNNGCTTVATISTAENTVIPVAEAGPNDTLSCSVNALLLNGSGSGNNPVQFNWSAAQGGNILNGSNLTTPEINAAGLYTITVTNIVNGCTAVDSVRIFNDLNAPVSNAGTAPVLTCSVNQFNLNGSGSTGNGISYNWTTQNGGNIISGPTTLQPIIDQPGTYLLTVINSNNGCSALSAITVLQDLTTPQIDAGISDTLTCSTGSLKLQGTASATNGGTLAYLWTGTGITSEATTLSPSINEPGTYVLSVTNALNGCTAIDQVQISIDTVAPTPTIVQPATLTCETKVITIDANVALLNGTFSANWNTVNGHFVGSPAQLDPTVDKPGIYNLTIQNTKNGCSTTISSTVIQDIVPPTALAASVEAITCKVPVVLVDGTGSSAGPIYTYNWLGSNGGNISGSANILTPSVDKPGTFTLTVQNTSNGCSSTASTIVTQNTTPPTLLINPPAVLNCILKSVQLTGLVSQPISGYTSSWISTNGQFVSGQNSLTPVVNQPGIYELTVINQQNGCSSTSNTTVLENIKAPGADAGQPAELNCIDTEASLQANSPSGSTLSYAWSSVNGQIIAGALTPAPVVNAPGTYQVKITDTANGCTSTDSVLVFKISPPVFAATAIQPNCITPKGTINISAVTGGEAPFTYSANGGQSYQTTTAFNQMPAGDYTLAVLDANGCLTTQDIILQEPVYPKVTLDPIQLIDLGDSIQLQASPNIPLSNISSWTWTPAEGLSCVSCPAPFAKPIKNTQYALTITNLLGCSATARVQVNVAKRRYVYAPNIFSPDGDGLNDRFNLFGKGVKTVKALRIYDRWGSELFFAENMQLNDESIGWDGNFRGNPVNPAVFVWQAIVEFLDGAVEILSGDVTVKR